jgi:polyisoprenyl-phosphate glycosyltransferase
MAFTLMTNFSVIIPALNEEAGIGPVLTSIAALYPQAEIVVVDDGSTDKTAEVACAHGAVVVQHPTNGGYGKSLKAGIMAAKNDVIVITDADGSYAPENIKDLLAVFDKGFDMVVGARSGKYYRGSFFKMPARILLKWLVEFTTGRLIPDINSGLRVFRKSQAVPYFPDLCQTFSFTTTITLIYMLTGKFVEYVPIEYRKRIGHSKVRIIRDSLRTLQFVTEVIVTYNPLKLFLLITLVLLGLAVVAFAASVYWNVLILAVIGLLSFFTAFIMFGLGLIAFRLKRS